MAFENTQTEALSSALDLILPPTFIHSSQRVKDQTAALLPLEMQAATSMRGIRLAEFSTSRVMMRELFQVLSPLNTKQTLAILPDEDGVACWPEDFIGSVSHSKGVCAVVVGKRRKNPHSIGMDIETLGRLSEAAKRRICSPKEQALVETIAKASGWSQQNAYTLVFSAKEAFYKYQFPVTRKWLEFQDVEVTGIDDESIQVVAPKLDGDSLPANRNVFYRFTNSLVATAVWS